MLIKETYNKDNKSVIDGIYIMGDHGSAIYIPFGICLAIADAIMTGDNDSLGTVEYVGFIEIYYDTNKDILLSDGDEVVRIKKSEVQEFSNKLWSLI